MGRKRSDYVKPKRGIENVWDEKTTELELSEQFSVDMEPSPSSTAQNISTSSTSTKIPSSLDLEENDASTLAEMNLEENMASSVSREQVEMELELETRLKDFHKARRLRQEFGNSAPFGIFGLLNYLVEVKIDLDWSKYCACRRQENEPILPWRFYNQQRKQNKTDDCLYLPWLTYSLILLSTLMMICEFYMNDWKIEPISQNPMIGPKTNVLIEMGALVTIRITRDGEYGRIIQSLFLYSGLIHYIINQVVLLYVVKRIERINGAIMTTIVFVVTGVAANTTCALLSPEVVMVGPLCAWFGLTGFCLADVIMNWDLIVNGLQSHYEHVSPASDAGKFPCIRACLILFIEVVAIFTLGLVPFLDNIAHLSGFIYGFGIGMILIKKESISSNFFDTVTLEGQARNMFWKMFWALVMSLLFSFTLFELSVTDGVSHVCPNCRYLSCVPFPFWKSHDEQWWTCNTCDRTTGTLTLMSSAGSSGSGVGGTSFKLEMTCPYGDTQTLLLEMENYTTAEELAAMVPEYCEIHCDLIN